MRQLRASLFLIVCAFAAADAQRSVAQEQPPDAAAAPTSGFFAVPFIVYSPETSWMVGAGVAGYYRTSTDSTVKPSTYSASIQGSARGQYVLNPDARFYFHEGRDLLWVRLQFMKSFEKYYGIGNETPWIDEPVYEMRRLQFRVEALRRISRDFLVGPVADVMWETLRDPRANPILVAGLAPGQELSRVIGLGAVLGHDSRENVYFPLEGALGKLSVVLYPKLLGSEAEFYWVEADVRTYLGTGPDDAVAFQLYGEFVGGDVPFFRMPALGGQDRMRGYFRGRYRDRASFAAQIEYRAHLFWRFGTVLFAGAGEVAPTVWRLSLPELRHSLGIGLRFRVDEKEKLQVRFDLGFVRATNGFYITVEEAF